MILLKYCKPYPPTAKKSVKFELFDFCAYYRIRVGLPIELAVFSGLWLGPRNCLGPIEVFPKAPLCKGLAICGGSRASKWPKMEK